MSIKECSMGLLVLGVDHRYEQGRLNIYSPVKSEYRRQAVYDDAVEVSMLRQVSFSVVYESPRKLNRLVE